MSSSVLPSSFSSSSPLFNAQHSSSASVDRDPRGLSELGAHGPAPRALTTCLYLQVPSIPPFPSCFFQEEKKRESERDVMEMVSFRRSRPSHRSNGYPGRSGLSPCHPEWRRDGGVLAHARRRGSAEQPTWGLNNPNPSAFGDVRTDPWWRSSWEALLTKAHRTRGVEVAIHH